ncbi:50S ribosomal protein L4 [Candidatus Woesearchaeota archaeon]|jgi:large subunit ribosomal protein L4e|nr:50S ribosomal protein L4 [Candidatus Woesearchaeota archaeon]MBT4387755.1 50S ribosomal protein L4 [Candidatus Woesearchaeota archaeon]MBT4595574.1 50S ribosomal protein L4 [Candidatus Woesearchaeota archaeon]MBT5740943.1 50S ribosomal protein L4 [Candidatus Woesearchaeota archaeon]MBT6506116.1 50S ribosomal protein L4 [Candidatus Woesearchaeota archaeon]
MNSLKIYDTNGKEIGKIEMPEQFNQQIKYTLIKKCVLALRANARQKYGADPLAGQKCVANMSHRRRKFNTAYGSGQSRIPRMRFSRKGTQFHRRGAFISSTIGGRRAHPPKAEKNWTQKINKKENRTAIRSALSASLNKTIVEKRGHKLGSLYPFILDDSFKDIKKTKQVKESLLKLDLNDELKRVETRKIRAGHGKVRGRRYVTKSGPLIVVDNDCDLKKSARNILGIEIVKVNQINAKLLAPGSQPGRLTLFTKSAIETMQKNKLFM